MNENFKGDNNTCLLSQANENNKKEINKSEKMDIVLDQSNINKKSSNQNQEIHNLNCSSENIGEKLSHSDVSFSQQHSENFSNNPNSNWHTNYNNSNVNNANSNLNNHIDNNNFYVLNKEEEKEISNNNFNTNNQNNTVGSHFADEMIIIDKKIENENSPSSNGYNLIDGMSGEMNYIKDIDEVGDKEEIIRDLDNLENLKQENFVDMQKLEKIKKENEGLNQVNQVINCNKNNDTNNKMNIINSNCQAENNAFFSENNPSVNNQNLQNTQQPNNLPQGQSQPQEDKNLENLKVQIESVLTTAKEYAYRNDNESMEFYRDKIPLYINQMLGQNMMNSGSEFLKAFFIFLIKYLNFRIDFLEEMTIQEFYAILKLLDPFNPMYLNYTNQNPNNPFTNEYFFKILSELVPQDKINNNDIYLSNWKIKTNPNNFYKITMIFLQEHEYIMKFILYLRKPFLDIEVFYNTYTTLSKLIYCYYHLDKQLILKLIKAINAFYKNNVLDNSKIKDLQKFHFDVILKSHIFFVFQLSINFFKGDHPLNLPDKEVVDDLKQLNLIDLDLIHFLLLTTNLEKKVIGIRSLADLILLIIRDENKNDKSIKGFDDPSEYLKILKFKKNILLDWMEDIKIFEIIFGENIHEALLKKSSSILIFLYMNNKLSLEKIDFIWKMAQEKHEAISASIQSIFSDLISYLSLDHVMHILKIINEIPPKEINDVTLKILESISNNKYLIDHSKDSAPATSTVGRNATVSHQSNNVNNNNFNSPDNLESENNNEIGLGNQFDNNINCNNNDANIMNPLNNFGSQAKTENISNNNNQNEIDENILDFIIIDNKLPSNLEIKEINSFKAFYLKIMWKLASDTSHYDGLSCSIINKSRKIISHILLKPVFKTDLIKYVKKSIVGIGLNQKLNTNLSFLENVLKNIKNILSNNNNKNVNNNINNNINYFNHDHELNAQNKGADVLSYFASNIKDFTGLINYLERTYQLSSTIFHAIVSVKKETMFIADEIIGVQEKISQREIKEIFSHESIPKSGKINQSTLQEIIHHYSEQIANINKHRNQKTCKAELDNFIAINSNSKKIIDNEMEIDLEDRDNYKINCNLNVVTISGNINNSTNNNSSGNNNINHSIIVTKKLEKQPKDIFFSNAPTSSEANGTNNNILLGNNNINNNAYQKLDRDWKNNKPEDMEQRANNNSMCNMDETLSTEKSFDDSISSYSTDISNLDKTKIYILKDFLEKNAKNIIEKFSYLDNYEYIFKNVKLNTQSQNYYQVIESLLEFLKFLVFSSNIQITQQQINYLYILLIENSVDENEMNVFFNFFAELFRYQQLTNQNYISDENLNYLLFDILLKLEISEIPASGFNLFKQIFFYINTIHNNIAITAQVITDIKNFKNILAFETLWRFYIESNNPVVLFEAKKLLVNLITTITKNEENAEALIIIFEKVFTDLQNLYESLMKYNRSPSAQDSSSRAQNLDDAMEGSLAGNEVKTSEHRNDFFKSCEEKAIRLIKLLSTLNSKQKLDKPKNAEIVNVNFHNTYFKELKKVQLQLPLDLKIKDVKQIIINKILNPSPPDNINMNIINDYRPIIEENTILMLYKGKILNNDKFTLKDYKFDNNGIINIHKGENYSTDFEIDQKTLNEYVNQVKFVFELDEEIIKRALKKNTYKIEDTIIYLTDETNIASIQAEMQEENIFAINEIETKLNIEIFKEKEVNMLLGYLNLGFESLSVEMWELLANIKYPQHLISSLIDNENINFSKIFSSENLNITLFNLKVINCLIFNDKFFVNIGKLDDNKKLEWKINLISSDGIENLLKLLFDCIAELDIIKTFSVFNINEEEKNKQNDPSLTRSNEEEPGLINININKSNARLNIRTLYHILQILSKWVHYFTMCASFTISNLKENLNFVIKQIIQNRPQGLKVGVDQNLNLTQNQINTSKDSSPSQTTPTFGSPHSSFSEGTKSTSFKQKSFLQPGMDENDNFLDEDSAHKYFSKLIFKNFQQSMIKFFAISQEFKSINEINQDNETVYLNFLEIMIIYNEMNPVAFKEFLINEAENHLIIDLLFKEKSKNIRKIVENIFNILIQNKNTEPINLKINDHEFKSTKEVIMMHIFNNYKKIFSDQVYEEFFNLFGYILSYDRELINSYFEEQKLNELSTHIISTIRNLSQKNDIDLSESEQEQLSGNIYLFQCLCLNYENVILPILDNLSDFNIINFFYKNLFSIEDREHSHNSNSLVNVRFKYSQRSLRQKTYDLLISFIKFKENFKKTLGEKLLTHHINFSNDYLEKFDINIGLRSSKEPFIGLFNYGCTCYLNSLLQQLYMIPQFRYNLFRLNVSTSSSETLEVKKIKNTNYLDDIEMNEGTSAPCLTNKINLSIKEIPPGSTEADKKSLEKNPVYQMQTLFANLSHSIKQYHSPLHFINSFKGFNNEPINVRIQQDCEEFLNILVDRLEEFTKQGQSNAFNGNPTDIFDDSFRGKISYEIVSLEKEYSYYSEMENPFLAISLDIKNKRTIEEALDLYVRGEVLEGENKYLVEKYNKKISILRRCSIKKLSKTVIIHLKRFEFDYNTFDKIKIIDYCQFPDHIDFKPWVRSTIISKNRDDPNYKDIEIDENDLEDTEAYKYQLTGILVHSGSTADGGHYYSIIYDYMTEKWFKFDDSRITEFNMDNIKTECFGEDKENQDFFSSSSQTAYLLFYTKISEKENIISKLKNLNGEIPRHIIDQINYENALFLKYKTYLDNDYFKFIHDFIDYSVLKNKTVEKLTRKEQSMSKRDLIDEEIFNEITNHLTKHNLIKNFDISNPQNLDFFKKLYNDVSGEVEKRYTIAHKNQIALEKLSPMAVMSINKPESSKSLGSSTNTNIDKIFNLSLAQNVDLKKNIIKFSIYFYFEIIVQQKDSYKMNSYSNFVRELIETDKRIACWFLKSMIKNKGFFYKMILEHSSKEIRESISRIILNCITALYNEEIKYIKEEFSKFELAEDENKILRIQIVKQYKSCIMRFFKNNIIDEFDSIRIHWPRFTQFLYIINECFNSMLFELVEMSLQYKLFNKTVIMIMNNAPGYETNMPTMGTKTIEVNLSMLLDLLSLITQSCITSGIIAKKQYSEVSKYQGNKNFLEMPKDWEIILSKEILGYVILKKYTSENIMKLIRHLSWGDEKNSLLIINTITSTLKENLRDIKALNNLLLNSNGIFQVDDELKIKRIKHFFCLDDQLDNDNDSIFNYFLSIKDDLPLNCLFCLNIIGNIVLKFDNIFSYFSNYSNNLLWIYYFLKEISSNQSKQDNLQIEASTENINYLECFTSVNDLYLEKLKIRKLATESQNMNNIYGRDDQIDSYYDFQQGIEMNTKIRNSNNNDDDFNADPPF